VWRPDHREAASFRAGTSRSNELDLDSKRCGRPEAVRSKMRTAAMAIAIDRFFLARCSTCAATRCAREGKVQGRESTDEAREFREDWLCRCGAVTLPRTQSGRVSHLGTLDADRDDFTVESRVGKILTRCSRARFKLGQN